MAIAGENDYAANVLRTIYLTPKGKIVLYVGRFHDEDRRAVGHLSVFGSLPELRTAAGRDSLMVPPAMIADAEQCVGNLAGKDLPNDFDAIAPGPRIIDSPFNRMRYPDVWGLPYRPLNL